MRVTMVIFSLGGGGAERVISMLANYWSEKGWNISLLTTCNITPFYKLHSSVTYTPLGICWHTTHSEIDANQDILNYAQYRDLKGETSGVIDALVKNYKKVLILRKAIKATRPQLVISFMVTQNIQILLATLGLKIPVLISERTDPSHNEISRIWVLLRKLVYPLADCIVVQSENALRYFDPHLQKKGRVIPNPIIVPSETRLTVKAINPSERKIVISIGRLTYEKGHDLLIQAFARVAINHPNWLLEIWGEGSERSKLEELCHKLGFEERVRLRGVTTQPFEQMRQADLFVLPSRQEGFPNALCEAMACGLPVISFDCRSGPRTIIRPEIDGILVPAENIEALAIAMDSLMSNENKRQALAACATEVVERFNLEKIMGMWEEAIFFAKGSYEQS